MAAAVGMAQERCGIDPSSGLQEIRRRWVVEWCGMAPGWDGTSPLYSIQQSLWHPGLMTMGEQCGMTTSAPATSASGCELATEAVCARWVIQKEVSLGRRAARYHLIVVRSRAASAEHHHQEHRPSIGGGSCSRNSAAAAEGRGVGTPCGRADAVRTLEEQDRRVSIPPSVHPPCTTTITHSQGEASRPPSGAASPTRSLSPGKGRDTGARLRMDSAVA